MTNKVWVYVDQFKGEALPASWEAVTAGRDLADKMGTGLTAIVIGSGVEAIANTAIQYGADEVLLADDASLEDYRANPYTAVFAKAAADAAPDVVLFPTTSRGREVAAMAAIDLNTGVLVDVTAMETEGDAILATRPVYAGKLLCKVKCATRPQLVTLRVRSFGKPELDESRTGTTTAIDAVMAEDEIATKVLDYVDAGGGVSLSDANVIVSGGRGVSSNPA
ncbi:MAG: electron transfer flavoprotein subunit alpha/FixB family protein, partial [Chloroflexi bacterium]|nr:electron transfer flavoprotein subunit alpha/FixB family protein [Chloroflexota bacterium]